MRQNRGIGKSIARYGSVLAPDLELRLLFYLKASHPQPMVWTILVFLLEMHLSRPAVQIKGYPSCSVHTELAYPYPSSLLSLLCFVAILFSSSSPVHSPCGNPHVFAVSRYVSSDLSVPSYSLLIS